MNTLAHRTNTRLATLPLLLITLLSPACGKSETTKPPPDEAPAITARPVDPDAVAAKAAALKALADKAAADKTAADKAAAPAAPSGSVGGATPDARPAVEAAKTPSGPALVVRAPTAADLPEYVAGLKGKGALQVQFDTTMGKINCELMEKEAPMTVANFVGLARGLKPFMNKTTGAAEKRPFYDGLTFHRVIPGFMIQGGDPLGIGSGDAGYKFSGEFHPTLKHDRPGILSMANAGPNTNGSQFFITELPTAHLDGGYNIFGRCKEVDVIRAIARVPKDPIDGSNSRPRVPVVMKKVTIHR